MRGLRDVARDLPACSQCGAPTGVPCVTANDRPCLPHIARLKAVRSAPPPPSPLISSAQTLVDAIQAGEWDNLHDLAADLDAELKQYRANP